MAITPVLSDFRNSSIAFFGLALIPTTIRIYLRYTKRLWWWDDTFAVIALMTNPLFVAGASLVTQVELSDRADYKQVLGYYLIVTGYYIPIWGARTSILFTIIRIAPWPKQRKILLGIAWFFLFLFVFLNVQIFWQCELTDPAWKKIPGSLCILGKAVPITQASTTLIADSLLVLSPLWILRNTRVDRSVRFRLVSVFSMSVTTILAATAHAVLVVASPGVWEAIAGTIEIFVTLTVGQASVLVPAAFRHFTDNEKYDEHESNNMASRTFNGHTRKRGNNTVLSTLVINPMGTVNNDTTRIEVTAPGDVESHSIKEDYKDMDGDATSYGSLAFEDAK